MSKVLSSLIFGMLQLCLLRYTNLSNKQCRTTWEWTIARNIKASIVISQRSSCAIATNVKTSIAWNAASAMCKS